MYHGVRGRGDVREDDVNFTAVEPGFGGGAFLGLWVEVVDGVCGGLGCNETQAEGEESGFEVELRHCGVWCG